MTGDIDLNYFSERLSKLRSETAETAEHANAAAQTVELDQNRIGRLSRMDAMQSQAMAQANKQRQQALIKEIDVAILRIERGDYGRCLECDEFIAPKRLEVDPTALYCIDCAAKLGR